MIMSTGKKCYESCKSITKLQEEDEDINVTSNVVYTKIISKCI